MHQKLFFYLMVFITCLSNTYAQTGAVYLQHYNQAYPGTQNNALVQTKHGTIMLAYARGARLYNGQKWKNIQAKSTLYTLLDDSTAVYTGGRSSFGYFKWLPTGQYQYYDLTHSSKKIPKETGDFRFVKKTKKHIYFLSSKALVQVSREKQKITQVWQNQAFQSLLVFKETVFVTIAGKGLYKLPPVPKDNDEKKKAPALIKTDSPFKDIRITSSFASAQALYLTASNNKVYTFAGSNWQVVNLGSQKYLDENTLTKGTLLGQNYLALGTLNGGVLVINRQSGKTIHTINHQTGLPDDEVLTVAQDARQGLWIAHAQGISRAVLNTPVTSFKHYPGLVGNLTSVVQWKGQLYVATTEGLFRLKKTQSFQDLVAPIKRRQAVTNGASYQTQTQGGTKVGNFINNVFGKKKARTRVVVQPKPQGPLKERNVLQRQSYALSSFPYFYHKIPNLSVKVNQIEALPDALLLGSSQGTYVYQNGVVLPILKDVYVHQLKKSPNNPQLIYAATNKGLKSLSKKGGSWTVTSFDKIQNPAYSIAFIQNELWLGSDNQVLKVQTDNAGNYQKHRVYKLPRYYVENVRVANIKQAPVLFLSNGLYRLDAKKQQFYRDSLLKIARLPYQIVQHHSQNVWTNLHEHWLNLADSNKVAYLSLFAQVSDIYQDTKKALWVINKNNLLKVDQTSAKDSSNFEVLISKVFDHQNQDLALDDLRLYQGAKTYSITFELGTPHYLNEQATQYQYRISGLTNGWSKWQKDSKLKFTFLPSGSHTLEIRAKNAIGQLSSIKAIDFRVVPPFWKRWWFYFIEVLVLVGLVVASAVSSRFERFERYSRLITFVTIITIFEFFILSLEPSVDNISGGVPLFKLFMNILLAMSLNPLERKFADWLSENKHRFQ